ncbi:glycosyltransferase family 4 protein [Paludibacterium purpuratum]|uniref:Glycosyltransferase involved in cell wall biosynthesis n=1 Tax=Paludibacterium purpuratum TaxID=1144873 RepID=A0A4V3DVF0_9NEIS|nr:glycosyltransferase family 4 protein [Paludibacterium purpuratum]TDR80769.1 glycosyltransferase involved in cell wall biosynthesis [Paludibacterium purpuratum]
MTKLRIAHLIDLDRVGGVESMYVDLISAPPPAGWRIEHYTVADSPNIAPRFRQSVQQHSRALSSPKAWHGIKLPRRPAALRARNRLAQIRSIRPDIVLAWNQFTDFHLPPDFACPLVYYEHGMSWYTHSPTQLQGFFPYVTAAIAASRASARMLQLKHNVAFPVTVCLNPLAPGQRQTGGSARVLPQGRPFRLGLAARLVPLKAAGLLVLTIKVLRERGCDAQAVIVGEGSEMPAIAELIRREKLEPYVSLPGRCDAMASFYRDIDLFVQTSMHESLSLVCLEAMAHGLPVICSQIDGMPEVVPHGVAGLCLTPDMTVEAYQALTGASTQFTRTVYDPALDQIVPARLLRPETLADAAQFLLGDAANYAAFSAGAVAHAAQGFDFDTYQASLYRVLADIAAKS